MQRNASPQLFVNRDALVLASASPRRSELLHQLGLRFTVQPASIDETAQPGENPVAYALRLATEKARTVSVDNQDATVIGADTVVHLDGLIYGKPAGYGEALATLQSLRGKTHQVTTGLAICSPKLGLEHIVAVSTRVTFIECPDQLLHAYIRTSDPFDKAGSYGIQGIGGFLVSSIHGSYTNVVGLPMSLLLSILLKHGLIHPFGNGSLR